jgi:hypothetical protein
LILFISLFSLSLRIRGHSLISPRHREIYAEQSSTPRRCIFTTAARLRLSRRAVSHRLRKGLQFHDVSIQDFFRSIEILFIYYIDIYMRADYFEGLFILHICRGFIIIAALA